MNNDNIYWLFSASAQCISAFIAFLLTGYALVYTMMQIALEKDDTLEEIHAVLRVKNHKHLTKLAIVTGFAIMLSLLMVFLNRWSFFGKIFLIILTTLANIVAIGGGMYFVVSIVNPAKYEKTAINVLKEDKTELGLTGKMTSSWMFFNVFRKLETIIRDYLKQHRLYIPSKGAPRMSFSFRQMVDALMQNEIINSQLYRELMQISKYRNLVFHGHVEEADETMVVRAKDAVAELKDQLG